MKIQTENLRFNCDYKFSHRHAAALTRLNMSCSLRIKRVQDLIKESEECFWITLSLLTDPYNECGWL